MQAFILIHDYYNLVYLSFHYHLLWYKISALENLISIISSVEKETSKMSRKDMTERLRNLKCSEEEKKDLGEYLFSCLAEGKNYTLKRNRVMIMDNEDKNKYVILDSVPTSDENKQMFMCPKCSHIDYSNYLTDLVACDQFNACIHSNLCYLIWGDLGAIIDVTDDEETHMIEVIVEKPYYLAVVHPSSKCGKVPGAVRVSSRTRKPKCLVCRGQDCCVHLRIHMDQYKREAEDDIEEHEKKKLRVDKIEAGRPQKRETPLPGTLDPFQHEGLASNVFQIVIDFLQTKENMEKNREVFKNSKPFDKKEFVPKYDPNETCDHGNKFNPMVSLLFVESTNIIIHHTKHVESSETKVYFRPAIYEDCLSACNCKKWYTGEDDLLIRVSSANERITRTERPLHFVSIEYCFSFISELVTSGETLNAFIKSKKFMDEIFFGVEKKSECRKFISKGFEIFIHALRFPELANYCVECPQELEVGEREDDFKNDIEYTIVDGVQMGCRVQDNKTEIQDQYFKEEVVSDIIVEGIESRDRTFLKNRKVRDIISNLLANKSDFNALSKAVGSLTNFELDINTRSVLDLLNRLYSEHKYLPECYEVFLHELALETPISALLVPYSSDKQTYGKFMEYLNNKHDIFASPSSIALFINKFPIITECLKNILERENANRIKKCPYLPTDVSLIVKNMIKLRFSFDKLSRKVAAPRVTPEEDFVPPKADCFPSYPIHTKENKYKADRKSDENEDDCEKNFNSASSISGGIATISCNHKITKGFRAIQKGESPVIFCHSILRRLPAKVKAHKRVVIYDFACKMHKCCLRRYPYRIRRFQFVIDRHHQANHKACSQAYNISRYPEMNHVNTQVAEQLNNSLRKLSTVVAYSSFDNYLKIIEIFITIRNLKIKKII